MKKVLSLLLGVMVMSVAFAQAPKDTYNLTMNQYSSTYYAEDGDWYCVLQNAAGDGFAFDIYAATIVSGQTYTFDADMDNYYSYAYVNGEEIDYSDASFTYTLSNGVEYVAATATLVNGDVYNLTYQRTLPVANDTVDVTIPSADLYNAIASDGLFQMYGYNGNRDWFASIVLASSQIAGNYTTNDFNTQYTYVAHLTTADTTIVDFYSGNATVTATATGYDCEAYLLCDDDVCYHIMMTYTAPVATDTVEIVCEGSASFGDYSDQDGSYLFVGFTADSTLGARINYFSTTIAGTYTMEDCDASYTNVYVNFQKVEAYDANFTVTATATGYAINAYILCTDNICYHVTMTYTQSGINTVSNDQVRVYPNPATDVLHVEANGINRIEVIDLAGRIVRTQVENTVNMSGLASGVYMLRTTTTEGVNVQKIVKK